MVRTKQLWQPQLVVEWRSLGGIVFVQESLLKHLHARKVHTLVSETKWIHLIINLFEWISTRWSWSNWHSEDNRCTKMAYKFFIPQTTYSSLSLVPRPFLHRKGLGTKLYLSPVSKQANGMPIYTSSRKEKHACWYLVSHARLSHREERVWSNSHQALVLHTQQQGT